MKKRIYLIISISSLIIFLVFAGLNIYKALYVYNLNKLGTFANETFPEAPYYSLADYNISINPISIIDDVEKIKLETDNVKTETIHRYNELVPQIVFLAGEISQLSGQASDLSITLTDNLEVSTAIYSQMDIYDEVVFKSAKDRYNYLLDYQEYLKSEFSDYKLSKSKLGKFSNPLWGYTDADLKVMIEAMSVEDKAGQMLFFSFDGISFNDEQLTRYRALNPGGMIIMNKNTSYAKQVQALTRQIQSINPNIPMFIPADQEGGVVKRINWDTTAGQKLWANMTDQEVCNLGTERSAMLLELGINMNFSPVVDLSYPGAAFINNRTISGDPLVVSNKAKAYIDCGQGLGIIDTLKHFPGHGPTQLDSHFQLPFVTKSQTDWLSTDAVPFKQNLQTKQIMIGHLVYTQIDRDNPATMSHIFLTDILRDEWGYDGLIITDDMNMLHTSTGISVHDALLKSINAGVDIVIYVGAPISFEEVKAELVDLINTDAINEERVNDALFRILIAKRDLNY